MMIFQLCPPASQSLNKHFIAHFPDRWKRKDYGTKTLLGNPEYYFETKAKHNNGFKLWLVMEE